MQMLLRHRAARFGSCCRPRPLLLQRLAGHGQAYPELASAELCVLQLCNKAAMQLCMVEVLLVRGSTSQPGPTPRLQQQRSDTSRQAMVRPWQRQATLADT